MLGRCRRIDIHRNKVRNPIEGMHIHALYMVTRQAQRAMV